MMGKIKKAVALTASLMVCISALFTNVSAASKWEIENTLDKSEYRQGDTLLLSVTLKGNSSLGTQEISGLSGVLEYDTSLFTVEKDDILPAEKEAVKEYTFDESEGTFAIRYSSGITIKDASQLLQIKLHVAENVPSGNTTVCITHIEWSGSDGKKKEEIDHHVPAYLTLQQAEAAGDVNGDGKVDLTDARLVMQHYNGAQTLDSTKQKSADVSGDGKVNLTDVKLLIQYYNGEIDEF